MRTNKKIDYMLFTSGEYKPHFEYWNSWREDIRDGFLFRQSLRSGVNHSERYRKRIFTLNDKLTHDIYELVNSDKTGVLVVLFSAFAGLLYKYSSSSNIVIHTPFYLSRQENPVADIVPIPVEFDGTLEPKEVLRKCQESLRRSYQYQNYPLQLISGELNGAQKLFASNIFLSMEGIHSEVNHHGYGLSFLISGNANRLNFEIQYDSDLFEDDFISLMEGHFGKVLENILYQKKAFNNFSIVTANENEQLKLFQNRKIAKDLKSTIVEAFISQALATPNNTAVCGTDFSLSYRELNEKSDMLAGFLITKMNLRPGRIVALITEKNENAIVSIMAILKTGCAYLPLDPKYPQQRIDFILDDAKPDLLLTDSDNMFRFQFEAKLCAIDILMDTLIPEEIALPLPKSNDLAYIIYTSGSTGGPKGVMIEHAGVVNMILSQVKEFNIVPDDRILSFASLSFDASVYEIFMALFSGACLVLPKKGLLSPSEYILMLHEKKVNVATFPPAFLSTLEVEKLGFMKTIISAGDFLPHSLVLRLAGPCDFYNAYGPTECSVCASVNKVSLSDTEYFHVPVGKPIDGTEIIIMDEYQNALPQGVFGELCISGPGIARGYLNNESLTDKKFIRHPFEKGERLYRTGDFGRWLGDGRIELKGRNDDQVKVRGFRIELKEVEEVLKNHRNIKDAIVIFNSSTAELIAYYVTVTGADDTEIKNDLSAYLPSHMLPQYFIRLQQLPFSINGKINKDELPSPYSQSNTKKEYVAPRNELESKLAEIWKGVLSKKEISINDSFFDLGGHSLLATQLSARITEELELPMELEVLFSKPTIGQLSEYIKTLPKQDLDSIFSITPSEDYIVSYAQKQIWTLYRMDESQTAYNLPAMFRFKGECDVEVFENSVYELMRRHEILRTTYTEREGELRQVVHEVFEKLADIDIMDLKNEARPDDVVKRFWDAAVNKPFNLREEFSLRLKLFLLPGNENIFAFTIHHIACDAWSLKILLSELKAIYDAFINKLPHTLPALKIQYKDYSFWQSNKVKELEGKASDYWKGKFNNGVSRINLLTDHPRPQVKTFKGETLNFVFERGKASMIKGFCDTNNISLFSVLLATVKVLLYRYTRQQEVVIGVPVSTRTKRELESQIGMYINTLPVHTSIKPEDGFSGLVSQVRQNISEALVYQDFPLELIQEKISFKNEPGHSTLFDITVQMENTNEILIPQEERSSGLNMKPVNTELKISQFDLSFGFRESAGVIYASFEFNTDLFERTTILLMKERFMEVLESAIDNDNICLDDLSFRSPSEKQLFQLNIEDDFNK